MRYEGIDTIGVAIETEATLDEILCLDGVVEEHTKILKDGRKYIALKPSKIFDKGQYLSSKDETEQIIEYVKSDLGVEEGAIMRIDFSIDMLEKISVKEKLYSLYLELLAVERKQEMMYKTIKQVCKTGNLKIRSGRTMTTIYDCTDKNRRANTRIENKYLDLESSYGDKDFSKKLELIVKKHLKELNRLEELMYQVEERYVGILKAQYDEDKKEGFIVSFTDFVIKYEKNILTSGILKQLHEYAGLKGTPKNWLSTYRKTRRLELITKKEVREFIGKLKRQYREILKS